MQDNQGEPRGDCRRDAREEADGLLLMFWANLAAHRISNVGGDAMVEP
jgi:hypothetical protein